MSSSVLLPRTSVLKDVLLRGEHASTPGKFSGPGCCSSVSGAAQMVLAFLSVYAEVTCS